MFICYYQQIIKLKFAAYFLELYAAARPQPFCKKTSTIIDKRHLYMSRAFLLLASCILQKKVVSMFLSVALKISELAHAGTNASNMGR